MKYFKHFTKVFIEAFLIGITFSFILIAQDKTPEKNVLARVYDDSEYDLFESWDNMKLEYMRDFRFQKDFLVVRFCTSDSLEVAINTSAVNVEYLLEDLEISGVLVRDEVTGVPVAPLYYVPRNRVIFMTNAKGCNPKNRYVTTEFWIVSSGNELPSFREARSASNLYSMAITSGATYFPDNGQLLRNQEGEKLTPKLYKEALKRTAGFMKDNKTALTIIRVPYEGKKPNKTLLKRASEVQKFLTENGIGDHRIIIKSIRLRSYPDSERIEYHYPGISISYEPASSFQLNLKKLKIDN